HQRYFLPCPFPRAAFRRWRLEILPARLDFPPCYLLFLSIRLSCSLLTTGSCSKMVNMYGFVRQPAARIVASLIVIFAISMRRPRCSVPCSSMTRCQKFTSLRLSRLLASATVLPPMPFITSSAQNISSCVSPFFYQCPLVRLSFQTQ